MDDELLDVGDEFRPMTRVTRHAILKPDDPIVMGPTDETNGHDSLDASLRDMTGVLVSRLHNLTHCSKMVTNANIPCWKSIKAAPHQKRKYNATIKETKQILDIQPGKSGSSATKARGTM